MNKEKKSKQKKILYHLRNTLLLIISGVLIYSSISELSTTLSLRKEIQEAKALASNLAKEKSDLLKQQEMLQDPNYVINYAKGKLLISQDGEQIFYVDDDK
ncbi:MAG: septum formation initiator family protein [Traorella sp.]